METSEKSPLTSMTYDQSVAYMSGLLTFGMKLDRERFVELLDRLGNPHKQLCCIHVAGTNGKGSTTTFIASVLTCAGYKTGAYLSPYVFDLRERILVNGTMIGTADFARHVSDIRPHIEAIALTQLGQTTEFELKTAVAFRHFAENKVDFAVIEVGIGGRLDATNVIDSPLVAVITQIGLDHQKILGETIEEIAAEKAGILKPGTHCVTAVADPDAFEVIERIARSHNVPVLRILTHSDRNRFAARNVIEYEALSDGVTMAIPHIGSVHYRLALRGTFQAMNCAAAAGALSILIREHGVTITPEAMQKGMELAKLPGRFQIIERDENRALVLDVAHNEDGARVLERSLRLIFAGQPMTFVVGMSKTHEPEPFLRILKPLIGKLIVTAPVFRPKPADETLAAAQLLGIENTELIEPASAAIRSAWDSAKRDEVVIVTGSFYTVGETPPSMR